ncbi:Multiple epidermal growth factor-like domains protein 8 [Balamuthia mandrillaris]
MVFVTWTTSVSASPVGPETLAMLATANRMAVARPLAEVYATTKLGNASVTLASTGLPVPIVRHFFFAYCQPLSLIRANTGVISDHKTTGDSLHNLKCKWDIAAEDFDPEANRLPGDTTIEIEFSQFDLERDYDFVRISDGKTDAELHSVAVYTGTVVPPPAFATSGRMALEFTTDQGITRTGFQAHFTASSCVGGCSGHGYCFDGTCHCDHGFTGTNCEQTKCEGDCGLHGTCNDTRQICDCEVGFSGADCSLCDKEQASECQTEYCTGVVTLKDQSGSFASHTGGGLYHPGSLCTWQIRPSTEEAFDSIIVTFDELFELELNKAFISAVDASNHVIARYTGGTKPAPVVTRDKRLTITFTADSNAATALGFHARYTTLKCSDSCSGHGVCLPTGCNCDLGWTGDNCNMTECSDPNCSGNGECIDDKCVCKPGFFGPSCATTHCSGVTELGAASGTFRDHSQGLQYIPNSNCVWVIKPVPASQTVTLHFTKFRLDSLTNDVVRVYEGESVNDDRLLLSHTGSFTPMPVVSQSGSMLVQFTSDSHLPQSPELTGFVAEYFSGASCPNACSSRGYCLDGSCVCFGAFAGSDCSRAAESTPITIGSTTVGSVEFLQWKYYQLEIPDPPPFQLQIQLTETAEKRQTDSENNRAQTRLYLNRGALPTPSKAELVDHTVDDIKYIYVRQPASGTWYLGVEGHNDEGATTFSIDIAYSCPPSCENGGECDEELFICRCVHCYGGPDCTGVNQEACGPNAVCVDDACACQEGFNGYAPFCGISEEDDDGGGGSSAAVAIVVVLILLIFFAFAMGGAFWFLRHKAEQQRRAPVTISGRAPPATAAGAIPPPVAAATSAPPPLQPRSEPEFDEEEGEEMEGIPSKQRKGGYAQFY